MALGFILASIASVLLVWSALPRAQFRRLLLDQRGGPGDGTPNWNDLFSSEAFANKVGEIASQAISGRTKSLKKEIVTEIGTDFEKKLGAFGEQLSTKLGGLETQLAQKRDKKNKAGGQEPDPNDDPDPSAVKDPMFRTLQLQVDELKRTNERLAREREAEIAKTRGITVRSRLREEFEKNGITEPHKLKALSAILVDQEKKVGYSESLDDAAGIDTDGASILLDQFVRDFLRTEEGQHWAPPKGAQGAGGKPGRGAQGRPLNGTQIDDVGELLADAVRRGEL